MKDDVIGALEAASILGVSARTVKRMVDQGRLTSAGKLSGRTGAHVFHRADIERLARQQNGAT